MTGLKIIAALIAGAFHRRAFGGWIGIRGAVMRLTPLAWAVPFWCLSWGKDVVIGGWAVLGFHMPSIHAHGWQVAVAATIAIWLHWNDGHHFDKPWRLLTHYSWAPVVIAVLTDFWPAILVGPVIAGSAAAFRALNLPGLWLPWDKKWEETLPDGKVETKTQQMIDGWEAYWEMVLGAVSSAAFVAAALVGLGH